MAYNSELVERIRKITEETYPLLMEKSMFGGFGYFINGNYAYGANEQLVVRVGPDRFSEAVSRPHARVMDITGRPMKGWVFVDLPGVQTDEQLRDWMQTGVDFASTLPSK